MLTPTKRITLKSLSEEIDNRITTMLEIIAAQTKRIEILEKIVNTQSNDIRELKECIFSIKETNTQLLTLAAKFSPVITRIGYFLMAIGVCALFGADKDLVVNLFKILMGNS